VTGLGEQSGTGLGAFPLDRFMVWYQPMTLRELTRTVTARVKGVSGCPVVVSEDASLNTLAASRIARGENKIHTISFNPSAVSEPDYLICYQCGFILRLFGVPAGDRVDLVGTAEGRQVVQRLLTASDGPGKKLKLGEKRGQATFHCKISSPCARSAWCREFHEDSKAVTPIMS
jgi:hypothetical protein